MSTHQTRRGFFAQVSAAGVALALPACALAKPPKGYLRLPAGIRAGIRSTLQALALARESILVMISTAEVQAGSDFLNPFDVQITLDAIVLNERALLSIGIGAGGPMTPAVRQVRDYQHRYPCNPLGLERATLAIALAVEELEGVMQAWDAVEGERDEEAGSVIRGAYWTLSVMHGWYECEVFGSVTSDEPDARYLGKDRKAMLRSPPS